jgi:hypothetical protein
VQAAVGLIGAAPLMNDVEFQFNITTQGRLLTPEEFGNIVVRASPDGALTKIKDIAIVELGARSASDWRRATTASPLPAWASTSCLAPTRWPPRVACREDEGAAALVPRGYRIRCDVRHHGICRSHDRQRHPTLIVAFVPGRHRGLHLPRQPARTLIPVIAVPVALVGTFAVMLALGFSANTISLLALVLAIGIVVDDAIVVVEAVEHIVETEPDLRRPGDRGRR